MSSCTDWSCLFATFIPVLAVWVLRSRSSFHRLQSLRVSEPETFAQVQFSLELIDQVFIHYPKDTIALAFNGGKDCLAVFLLVEGVPI